MHEDKRERSVKQDIVAMERAHSEREKPKKTGRKYPREVMGDDMILVRPGSGELICLPLSQKHIRWDL